MVSPDQLENGLAPLCGELPPADSEALTLMVCSDGATLAEDVAPVLQDLSQRTVHNPVHLHILNMDDQGLAYLTLLGESLPGLQLSITTEVLGDTVQLGPPGIEYAFGLVRLLEIHSRVPAKYVFLNVESIRHISIEQIENALSQWPALMPGGEGPGIAVNSSVKAKKVVAAVAQPLLNRIQTGTLRPGDYGLALSSVKSALTNQSPELIGPFPNLQTGPDHLEADALDLSSGSQEQIHKRLWKSGPGAKSTRRILLLKPDMTLPFKSPKLVSDPIQRKRGSPFLSGSMGELRDSWENCFDHLESALKKRDHTPLVITRPGSELTPALANMSGADVVIMPHRQRFQCPGLSLPTLNLMQIAHRWLFTVDQKGWGAGAEAYPYEGFRHSPANSQVYDFYRDTIRSTNESKFDQPDRKSKETLISEGVLPVGNYLFFPCQIPDDEVVRFFCDVKEEDVIAALAHWANTNKVKILFKSHPAAPSTSGPFKKIATGPYVQWVDASIHDLIEHCQAVYTLNSGVGHEAILHGKPVVMFGRAEYDRLAIRSTLNELDEAYKRVQEWDEKSALEEYQRFYHWFTRDMAIDLMASDHLEAALDRVVDLIETL